MENDNRTSKSIKNATAAIMVQLMTTIIAFVTRTALIKTLGIKIVGLNGLFTEVISILSLTEMGVGTAIVYNLYRPLAEKNYEKINQLMNLFRRVYIGITLATLIIGTTLIPVIQYLIKGVDYPIEYIRLIYLLFVIQTAATYLFSYKTSLLNADQKTYIVSIVQLAVRFVGMTASVAFLVMTHNFIAYLVINIIVNLAINAAASFIVDRKYPYLKRGAALPKEESKEVFANVKNLFIKSLSGRITNSTDNILISTLVSTIQVGYYSNYAMFLNVMKQISTQLSGSITGSLGNLVVTESSEHCDLVLRKITYLFHMAASVTGLGMLACLSIVIELWLGPEYVLGAAIVFIIVLNMYMEFVTRPLWAIMNVSGLFRQDKNISILGSALNLLVSILLGIKAGIVGIFIGTLCTYIVQVVLKIKLLYHDQFKLSAKRYYIMWSFMFLGMLIMMAAVFFLVSRITAGNLILRFLMNGIIAVTIGVLCNVLLSLRTTEFKYMMYLMKVGMQKVFRHKRR